MDDVGLRRSRTTVKDRSPAWRSDIDCPGGEVRVTRLGDGLLLQPAVFDGGEWRAKLDEYRGIPFMEDGRQQPPTPDGSDISFDR